MAESKYILRFEADSAQAQKGIRDVNTALGQTAQAAGSAAVGATKVTESLTQTGLASTTAAVGTTRVTESLTQAGLAGTTAAVGATRVTDSLGQTANAAGFAALSTTKVVDSLAQVSQTEGKTTASVGQVGAAMAQSGAAAQKTGQAYQVSAAQTNAAMRQLPAQLTDVVTQLQGGASPLTVLIQQGGQVKDSFGGIGPAARALGGALTSAITPVTAVLGTAVAASLALLVAYKQGAAEGETYARGLILSGNAAGVTSSQLGEMARSVAKTTGTVGAAADALAQLAVAPNIDSSGLAKFAQAAVMMERTTGVAVADTVAQFSDLGRNPLQASIKLNESTNYLTASVYAQIRSLTEQGRTAEAAALAQSAYADAGIARSEALTARLGTLERAWLGIKDGAKGAWDSMLDIGRPTNSLDDQVKAAQKRVDELAALNAKGGRKGLFGESIGDSSNQDLSLAQGDLFTLQASRDSQRLAAKQAADAAALVKARNVFDDAGKAYLTSQKKLQLELDVIANTGKEAGASPEEIKTRQDAARFAYDLAQRDANNALRLARAKQAQDTELQQADVAQAALDALRQQGLISERSAAQQSSTIEIGRLNAQRDVIQQQIALEKARPVKPGDPGAQDAKAAKLVELDTQLQAVDAKLKQAPLTLNYRIADLDLSKARSDAAAWAQIWEEADKTIRTQGDTLASGRANLLGDSEALLSQQVARIERDLEPLRTALALRISLTADPSMRGVLQAQLDQVKSQSNQSITLARDQKAQSDAREASAAYVQIWTEADNALRQGEDANAQARAALLTDPLEQAREQTRLQVVRIQRDVEPLRRALALRINLTTDPGTRDVLQAQLDALDAQTGDAIELANAGLADRLKPGWQKLIDGWGDTTKVMRDTFDSLTEGVVKQGEDAFVKFAKDGKTNIRDLTDFVRGELARSLYRQGVGQKVGGFTDALLKGNLPDFLSGPTGPGITLGGVSKASTAVQDTFSLAGAGARLGDQAASSAAGLAGAAASSGGVGGVDASAIGSALSLGSARFGNSSGSAGSGLGRSSIGGSSSGGGAADASKALGDLSDQATKAAASAGDTATALVGQTQALATGAEAQQVLTAANQLGQTQATQGAVEEAATSTATVQALGQVAAAAFAASIELSKVAVSSGLAGFGSAVGHVFTGTTRFAAGGSFSAYSNRVIDTPTNFRFRSGGVERLGLMGEAGPEAVMPLDRSAGGLGVAAVDGNGRHTGQTLRLARGRAGRLSVVLDGQAIALASSAGKSGKAGKDGQSGQAIQAGQPGRMAAAGGRAAAAGPGRAAAAFATGGWFGRRMAAFASGGTFAGQGARLAQQASSAAAAPSSPGSDSAAPAGSAGVVVNQTINVQGNSDRNMLMDVMRQARDAAVAAINEQTRRGNGRNARG